MNDQDVFTSVKERFGGVRMTTPLDTVTRRGRALRSRRLGTGLAGGAAAASGLALAVTALVPGTTAVTSVAGGGHGGGHGSGPATLNGPAGAIKSQDGTVKATLAAWTVTKRPGGAIGVTVRDLRDPAGLQRALRADGVPATVTYPQARIPASCRFYDLASASATRGLRSRVITEPAFTVNLKKFANLVIHLPALPRGAGVLITGAAMPANIRAMPATLAGNPAEHVQAAVLGGGSLRITSHDSSGGSSGVTIHYVRASFLETSLVHAGTSCTGS
jgi:hypothetical protein